MALFDIFEEQWPYEDYSSYEKLQDNEPMTIVSIEEKGLAFVLSCCDGIQLTKGVEARAFDKILCLQALLQRLTFIFKEKLICSKLKENHICSSNKEKRRHMLYVG